MSKKQDGFTEPEKRSMELLSSIVDANDWVQSILETNKHIRLRVRGESGRWYEVEAKKGGAHARYHRQEWGISVRGGARKRDIIHRNKYCANLCINLIGSMKVPLGDKIASLCLALHNDRTTAMTIPLLAQFIVASREHLTKVAVFQDEYIVYESMLADDFIGLDEAPPEEGEVDYYDGVAEDYNFWENQLLDTGTGIAEPSPEPEPHPMAIQLSEIEVPPLTPEEIEEQKMWEDYERHMEHLAQEAHWNDHRRNHESGS